MDDANCAELNLNPLFNNPSLAFTMTYISLSSRFNLGSWKERNNATKSVYTRIYIPSLGGLDFWFPFHLPEIFCARDVLQYVGPIFPHYRTEFNNGFDTFRSYDAVDENCR